MSLWQYHHHRPDGSIELCFFSSSDAQDLCCCCQSIHSHHDDESPAGGDDCDGQCGIHIDYYDDSILRSGVCTLISADYAGAVLPESIELSLPYPAPVEYYITSVYSLLTNDCGASGQRAPPYIG